MWFPLHERSRIAMAVFGGGLVGTFVGLYGYGITCERIGWEYTFYVPGVLLLTLSLIWAYFGHITPQNDPNISVDELDHICANLQEPSNFHGDDTTNHRPPYWAICKSKPVYGLLAGAVADNFFYTTISTYTPLYLSTEFHLDLEQVCLKILKTEWTYYCATLIFDYS